MVVESLARSEDPFLPGPAPSEASEPPMAGLEFPTHLHLWPPSKPPSTRPIVLVDTAKPGCHSLHFLDENTPRVIGKPAGIEAVEIWAKLGDGPPASPQELVLLARDTHSPHLVQYSSAQIGQTAYYQLRWINAQGDKGPWSELFSAPVIA